MRESRRFLWLSTEGPVHDHWINQGKPNLNTSRFLPHVSSYLIPLNPSPAGVPMNKYWPKRPSPKVSVSRPRSCTACGLDLGSIRSLHFCHITEAPLTFLVNHVQRTPKYNFHRASKQKTIFQTNAFDVNHAHRRCLSICGRKITGLHERLSLLTSDIYVPYELYKYLFHCLLNQTLHHCFVQPG